MSEKRLMFLVSVSCRKNQVCPDSLTGGNEECVQASVEEVALIDIQRHLTEVKHMMPFFA